MNAQALRTQLDPDEALTEAIIGAAIDVHRHLGPGLLERIYERALRHEFTLRAIPHAHQVPDPIRYKGEDLGDDLRLDLVVANRVIVDLKAKKEVIDVDKAQLLSYLRLSGLRLGLLINFHTADLTKGVHRLVNGYSI